MLAHVQASSPDQFQQASPDTATALNNQAALCFAQGQDARAEELYQRALTMRQQLLGEEHPETVQTLNNLAELFAR